MSSSEFNNKFERSNSKRKSAISNERKLSISDLKKTQYKNGIDNSKKNINLDISGNNDQNEDNKIQDEIFNENREKQLTILNEKFTRLYESEKKIYENIIKEIDVEKDLIYKGSLMSFNLLI